MATEAHVNASIDFILKLPSNKFEVPQGFSINTSDIIYAHKLLQNVLRKLKADSEALPYEIYFEISDGIIEIERIYNVFLQVFPKKGGLLSSQFESIKSDFLKSIYIFLNNASIIVVPILFSENNIGKIDNALRLLYIEHSKLQGNEHSAKKAFEEIKGMGEESKRLLSEIKTVGQEITVAKYNTLFEAQAKEHKKNSTLWLGVSIILFVVIIYIGQSYYGNRLFIELEGNKLIAYLLSRLVILSALFYGVTICMKSYKANKHNEILNKHRQNALNTFEVFLLSSTNNDPQVKNAILMEVTRTIFSNQNTGFNSDDRDDGPNKIIEIVKNISTSKNQS